MRAAMKKEEFFCDRFPETKLCRSSDDPPCYGDGPALVRVVEEVAGKNFGEFSLSRNRVFRQRNFSSFRSSSYRRNENGVTSTSLFARLAAGERFFFVRSLALCPTLLHGVSLLPRHLVWLGIAFRFLRNLKALYQSSLRVQVLL
ncbi:hypothetical protein CH375_19585 [Leptospira ellisii]|uniref:Uncharacterized protein n=1 Tax=Leptospira ellisii TaxID=2023197 RepID=A0A2N0BG78_9LEPT|nr:hypothetical protein CH379_10285 [Leptospira ellisii]PKA03002.1 hypothetical protein CH375_19585 [Leptospira ellisii]